MVSKTLYSSKSDEWSTPTEVFDALDAEFDFNLDPCASDNNCKVPFYFTKEQDGLKQLWAGCRVFCNPPYSNISAWVEKAFRESRNDNTLVVMLLSSRTDTKYFHNFIYQ